MEGMKRQKRKGRMFRPALLLLYSLTLVMFSEVVLAQGIVWQKLGGVGNRIGNMFSSYAANPGPTFFDLIIFFVIFFALCWIGFNQVFKEARNANIALSVAVGLALSIALVYGGKFTLKKLLPFAAVILFMLIIVGIYALLKKFLFTKDTAASKIISFMVAIIISIALLFLAWSMMCSDYGCERSPTMQKVFGSQSIIGKLFGGVNSAFGGSSYSDYSPTSSEEPVGYTTPLTPGTVPKKEESGTTNYLFIAGIVIGALLLLGGGYLGTRKLRKMWKKSPAWVFASRLKEMDTEEKSIIESFRQLCEAVKNEQTTLDQSRHIVDKITTDIKETIGGEIDFVKGQKKEIDERIDQLRAFNITEKHIVEDPSNGILTNIQKQLVAMNTIPAELKKEIDAFKNIAQHFDEHDKILQTFKQYNFSEAGSITNLLKRLNENKASFTELAKQCERLIEIYTKMQAEVATLAGKRKLDNYPKILEYVRAIRDGAIRLNKIFAWKVSMIHYLGSRMKEVQDDIEQMHETERATMEKYLSEAEQMKGQGSMDIAIYLALHVLENVKYLKTAHLRQDSMNALDSMVENAKKIISEAIPKLFNSFKDRIQGQLLLNDHKRVMKLVDTISRLQSVEADLDKEFSTLINNTYANKLATLKMLCKTYIRTCRIRADLENELQLLVS